MPRDNIPIDQKHIGGNNNTYGNFHISTSNVLVSFGPPKLTNSSNTPTKAINVGLVRNLSISQQRQIMRLFEYGSEDYALVAGKIRATVQMNRVLFDGPSLFKYVAYAYLNKDRPIDIDKYDHEGPEYYKDFIEKLYEKMGYNSPYDAEGDEEIIPDYDVPGTGDFWLNLSSDLFNNPIGIFITIQQKTPKGNLEDYGGIFLENCLISSHNLNMVADNRILGEQLSMEFGKVIPLKKYDGNQISRIERSLKEIFKNETKNIVPKNDNSRKFNVIK